MKPMRALLVAASLTVALAGCSPDEYELIVNVRTDLAPGVDFDQAIVELYDERGTFGERLRRVETRAVEGDDFTGGFRVAELQAIPGGFYVVRAALLLDGTLVVDALGPLELRENRAVTVDVTRACVGISCPQPEDPNATVCVAGTCARPECLFSRNTPGCPMVPDGGLDSSLPLDSSVDALDAGVDGEADADADADAGPTVPPGYVLVPEGPFQMGCNASLDSVCESHELPRHEVFLSAYYIMVREVSMLEWASCIEADECPIPDDGMWWTPMTTPNDPVVDISRAEAEAYCRWVGGRLPTEAEWEKAARGTDGRVYPWGNDPPSCSLANYIDCGDVRMPVDVHDDVDSPYGTINMAGNVWEWVSDYYGEDYYSSSPTMDPRGPATGTSWVIRGGSHDWPDTALRTSKRLEWDHPTAVIGVRCVRDVE
jgi:formylglycine-generating enzyme required for sulfatase activity